MRGVLRIAIAGSALALASVFWDAHRSDVAFVDVFFAAAGGLVLGAALMLRQWAAAIGRLPERWDMKRRPPSGRGGS